MANETVEGVVRNTASTSTTQKHLQTCQATKSSNHWEWLAWHPSSSSTRFIEPLHALHPSLSDFQTEILQTWCLTIEPYKKPPPRLLNQNQPSFSDVVTQDPASSPITRHQQFPSPQIFICYSVKFIWFCILASYGPDRVRWYIHVVSGAHSLRI